ncbi:MAG: PDZ domain-containing protein [Woeseiaceae bacterium]|jgi:C-terminal processing protease CtpA/Prc
MHRHVQTAVIALVSAAAGALLVWFLLGPETPPVQPDTSVEALEIEDLRDRVAALEDQLEPALPEEAPVEETPPVVSPPLPSPRDETSLRNAEAAILENREQRIATMMERRQRMLDERLREAGWTDADIQSLRELQEEASLELAQRRYEGMREAMEAAPERSRAPWREQRSVLRESLGDEKYEQYLAATGRPAAVQVTNVLAGSAGDAAGLRPGDRIRRYGSERVFNEGDLMHAILQGTPGETVSVEIERNGSIFHVSVPRGPLGTSIIGRYGLD